MVTSQSCNEMKVMIYISKSLLFFRKSSDDGIYYPKDSVNMYFQRYRDDTVDGQVLSQSRITAFAQQSRVSNLC